MIKELKTRQICLFYIAFIPLAKLFILPSILSQKAEEDMWISACLNLLLDLLTLIPIIACMRKCKTDFFTLLKSVFGRFGSSVILVLYFAFFMLKGLMPICEQKDYVELTLYTVSPRVLYFLPFFLVAFYFCTKKLRALGRASDVLWLTTSIGFVLLFALSVTNCDFSAILPIGAQGGKKILNGSVCSFAWFGDSAYILFLIGEFTYTKKDGLKIILAQVISSVIIVMFLMVFYAIFSSIAHRQRFALTEISKYTTVINNIGRFDYLAIMFILFSNLFAMSMPTFFASKILDKLFLFKKGWIAPLITVSAECLLMLLLTEFQFSLENFVTSFGSYFSLFVGSFLTAIIPLVLLWRMKYANT